MQLDQSNASIQLKSLTKSENKKMAHTLFEVFGFREIQFIFISLLQNTQKGDKPVNTLASYRQMSLINEIINS